MRESCAPAMLSERVRVGLPFKERAGDIVKEQVVFQIEEFAEPVLEMNLQSLLVRQKLIQSAIPTVVINVLTGNSQQVRQCSFGVPLLCEIRFAGGFQQTGDQPGSMHSATREWWRFPSGEFAPETRRAAVDESAPSPARDRRSVAGSPPGRRGR